MDGGVAGGVVCWVIDLYVALIAALLVLCAIQSWMQPERIGDGGVRKLDPRDVVDAAILESLESIETGGGPVVVMPAPRGVRRPPRNDSEGQRFARPLRNDPSERLGAAAAPHSEAGPRDSAGLPLRRISEDVRPGQRLVLISGVLVEHGSLATFAVLPGDYSLN